MTKRHNASSSSAGSAETVESEILQPKSKISKPKSGNQDNEALERCVNAWHRNFDLASINPTDDNLHSLEDNDDNVFACEQGANAFRNAMPILVGYENIRDFIACTTYAMLVKILEQDECRGLLCAAKIAMALLKAQPKSPTSAA